MRLQAYMILRCDVCKRGTVGDEKIATEYKTIFLKPKKCLFPINFSCKLINKKGSCLIPLFLKY